MRNSSLHIIDYDGVEEKLICNDFDVPWLWITWCFLDSWKDVDSLRVKLPNLCVIELAWVLSTLICDINSGETHGMFESESWESATLSHGSYDNDLPKIGNKTFDLVHDRFSLSYKI